MGNSAQKRCWMSWSSNQLFRESKTPFYEPLRFTVWLVLYGLDSCSCTHELAHSLHFHSCKSTASVSLTFLVDQD
jgi:hypothetical protein